MSGQDSNINVLENSVSTPKTTKIIKIVKKVKKVVDHSGLQHTATMGDIISPLKANRKRMREQPSELNVSSFKNKLFEGIKAETNEVQGSEPENQEDEVDMFDVYYPDTIMQDNIEKRKLIIELQQIKVSFKLIKTLADANLIKQKAFQYPKKL